MTRDTSRSTRRSFVKYAGTGITATALAGCTGGGGNSGNEQVKIGIIAPTDAPVGKNIDTAAQIAVDEINNNGGFNGAQAEVIVENSNYDTQQTVSAYQDLTTGENVDLTMGPYVSEAQLAIMQNIAQQQTLHMNVASGTPETTRRLADDFEKFKYYFRIGPLNGVFRGREAVKFASNNFSDFGWERVAVLVEDYAWTEPISNVLNEKLSSATEAEIVMNRRFSGDTNDFSPLFDEAESQNADGVLTAIAHTGTNFLVQWADQQPPFGMSGVTVPAEDPTYYQNTDGKCQYVVGSCFGGVPGAYLTGKGSQFAQAYAEADGYGGAPMYPAFHTYDGIKMFAKAANEASSVNPDDLIPVLEDMSHQGTAGTIEFYGQDHEFPHDVKHGNDLLREMQYQWQEQDGEGTQIGLAPEEIQEGEYVSPDWI